MTLDPRTVAVQGVQATPLLVAVQGVLPAAQAGAPPATALGGRMLVGMGRLMGR